MILAFASMKGGTGKSTLAAHSYGYLRREGVSRWLIDMDPQASSFDWLKDNDPDSTCEHVTDLKQASEAIRARARGSDVVIVDGAGALTDPTKAALLVADVVVVPCRPSRMDFKATQAVLDLAKEANRHRDRPVKVLIVPSMVRTNDSMSWQLHDELADLGVPIAPAVSYRVSFAKAAGDGDFVWDHNDNQATAEIELLMEGIADYV